jgi:hypothetical protein
MTHAINFCPIRVVRAALLVGPLFWLAACATGLVTHAFSFDMRESLGATVLDYRYVDSRQPAYAQLIVTSK